ncbi:cysteine--tRNA ligase [Aeromicrobium phragmitis]|uniref:Cysteine--tRNA ligase n=1 Tax=Aeromicrobium phragmitis TaxID=2478914 RepID=A0A3L8PI39_9ACTN|nr:cysteine--tRNA ligase [Aeromicrobium phragmitis]RLV54891.1 cysteine--tRNA ligase [Aeromicrobium phragmitis]
MTLHLFDSATRRITPLDPVVPGRVGIYHCGLTVQGPPHIGHIRKEVVFDVLRRWLERAGYEVRIIANVTDIDDKILAKGAETGEPWFAVAYRNERALHAAYEVLGCQPPTYEPRATGHVPEMIGMIAALIERGHAYPAEDGSGDVYFDVRSWPAYGELSNQSVNDMQAAPDAPLEGKRDPRDFALWKGHKEGEPESASWPTPWGRGRPGWHLECSAMAAKYLGPEFDIHGGGLDLRFPHHENELAQSRAAGQPFARIWMHNAMLNLGNAKMSKSVGNTLMVSEVVKRVPPIALRYYLVAAHYRSIIEFSEEALAEAATAFSRIEGFVRRAAELVGPCDDGKIPDAFAAAMDDDLSVPAALAVLQETVAEGNKLLGGGEPSGLATALGAVRAMLDVLGLDPLDPMWASSSTDTAVEDALAVLVQRLIDQRAEARGARDFATADRIRDQLAAAGVEVEDTPQGARWSLKEGER